MQISSFTSQAELVSAVVERIIELVDRNEKDLFSLVVTG